MYTKTKEMIKGKVERPLATITFDIKQEVFLKLLGVFLHANLRNWDKQIDSLLGKAGRQGVFTHFEFARSMVIV